MQKDAVTCRRSHSQDTAELGFEPPLTGRESGKGLFLGVPGTSRAMPGSGSQGIVLVGG